MNYIAGEYSVEFTFGPSYIYFGLFLLEDFYSVLRSELEPVLSEIVAMRSELEPMQKALKHVLELSLDPWEQIHSDITDRIIKASAAHLNPVCTYYGVAQHHFCMVLGRVTHCDIICANIWPAHTNGKGLEAIDLKREDVNNPRNFLRLHRSIERAFDKKRLYFFVHDEANHGGDIQLIVVIVDPVLLTETYNVNNATHSFADLQGCSFAYRFTKNNKPYLSDRTIEKAQGFGWIDT